MSAPAESRLSDDARRVLETRAIDPQWVVAEHGVYEATTLDEVPEELRDSPWVTLPMLVFWWTDLATGERVPQGRPHKPKTREDGATVKYVFPEGRFVNLGLIRPAATTAQVSLIVEGTMQSLVAARYAADDVAVYAIPGCWGWSEQQTPTGGLAQLDGTSVIGVLDADADRNRDVYDAGARLADAVASMAGADMLFARLGAGGTQGLDDVTAGVPEERRAAVLANLITGARKRPADRAPEKKKRKGPLGQATSHGLPDPNDTWLATTWADEGALARWRFLTDAEHWLGYRIGRWERASKTGPYDDVARYCNDVAQQWIAALPGESDPDEQQKMAETARLLLSHRKIDTVLSRAAGHSDFHVRRTELDQHPALWAAGNGVIDLASGEFREHDPALLLTAGSDVVYDPHATCPRFDAFLAEVLPDDEVREYLMRVFAVAMWGEVRANAHILPVLIGEGRNGKGTVVRIMSRLFGQYKTKINTATLMERKIEPHAQEIAKLRGKRLATAEETNQGARWNVGRLTSWTGGDTLTGNMMRENDQEWEPSHTLIMTTNHRPNVGADETAFWMRYREIPFDVSVEGREDPTLEPHIFAQELPGVLNRLLAAGQSYLAHGLATPAAVMVAVAEAREDSDHVARFAEETLIRTDHDEDRLLAQEVYRHAQKWWSQNVTTHLMPSDRGRGGFNSQLRHALGWPPDANNPKKVGKGPASKLTWTGVRWLDGGATDSSIPALPGSANTGSPETPGNGRPAATDRQGSDDPEGGLPTTTSGSADGLPEADQDHSTVFPGDEVASAESAESDETGMYSIYTQKHQHGPSESGSVDLPPGVPTTTRAGSADRQTWQTSQTPATLPEATTGTVVFDIETGDSDRAYDHPDPAAFVRLAGHSGGGPVAITEGPVAITERVATSRKVIGHNVLAFDLPVLARVDPRVDVLAMARQGRVLDTMVTESVLHPVLNDKSAGSVGKAARHFALDATAARYGVPGKTDDLKAMAKRHGGYDAIPLDPDSEDGRAYRAYLEGDVKATMHVVARQNAELGRRSPIEQEYVAREHRVHAIASTMGTIGLQVDQKLLQERFWAGYGHKMDLTRELIARYDIPTTKADGKPADSPAATKGGKEAVLRALHGLGADLSKMGKTKANKPSFGGDDMAAFAEAHEGHRNHAEIAELCSLMGNVAGVRTVYGTALEYLHADGRVHPQVATFQASGRWSVRNPGLTVFGKRGGRVTERAIFTATDPEHVLFAIDLSQIDARAIAVHSQDPGYMALFEPGRDAHEIVARMVWGDAAYDADPKGLRQTVKAITHGLPYGMGVPKLATSAKVDEGVAQSVVDTMNERFPRLQAWKDEVREQAATGEPLDNGFGRRMLPDPERAYTQGVALMGQGTARDLMMECLLRLPDELARCLRAQVHDEAVFEAPLTQVDEVKREVERAFNFEWLPPTIPNGRPIRIEAEAGPHGRRWSDCY